MDDDFQLRLDFEYGDDWFSITGTQLNSQNLVRMLCRYRNDGKPARFTYQGRRIPATVSAIREDDKRGLTTIGDGDVRIRQVEHILSALNGMNRLDTDIILAEVGARPGPITSISPPIGHLNAADFATAIGRTFTSRTESPRIDALRLAAPVIIDDPVGDSLAIFVPHASLHLTVVLEFPVFWAPQVFGCEILPYSYQIEIAPARSFFATPFPHETPWGSLRMSFPGLIREYPNHYRSIMLDYDRKKWLSPPRWPEEPARHKLLDLIGDLALLGRPLKAAGYVYKPYHRFNRHCARVLCEALSGEREGQ